MIKTTSLCAGFMLLLPVAAWGAPTANEIMLKSEENRLVKDITSQATLTTVEAGKERVKTFTYWRKTNETKRFNTMTRFATPAEIRGEGILFLERDRDTNDVFLFLPNMKKVRRVESQSQRSPFMGSAFSYSDVTAPHVYDFEHKLLRSEPCPGGTVSCFVIESKPASEKLEERTGYARVVRWINSEHFQTVQGEFYNSDGELVKKLSASKVIKVDEANNKWLTQTVSIEEVKSKRTTTLDLAGVKVNTGVADSIFTEQNLMRE